MYPGSNWSCFLVLYHILSGRNLHLSSPIPPHQFHPFIRFQNCRYCAPVFFFISPRIPPQSAVKFEVSEGRNNESKCWALSDDINISSENHLPLGNYNLFEHHDAWEPSQTPTPLPVQEIFRSPKRSGKCIRMVHSGGPVISRHWLEALFPPPPSQHSQPTRHPFYSTNKPFRKQLIDPTTLSRSFPVSGKYDSIADRNPQF